MFPCESAVKLVLPALRASIAKRLYEDYDFSQEEIAASLGLTQAAVSKYLSGKYGAEVKELEKAEKIRNVGERVASGIAKTPSASQIFREVCNCCREMQGKTGVLCGIRAK